MESWREELYHSAKGTSWEKTNHKYIERKKVNGKWVYRYTDDSPRAKENKNAEFYEKYSRSHGEFGEKYDKLGNPVKANAEYRKAQHLGEKATQERLKGRSEAFMERDPSSEDKYKLNFSPEFEYKAKHKVDYYVHQGEAFIERLLKKK